MAWSSAGHTLCRVRLPERERGWFTLPLTVDIAARTNDHSGHHHTASGDPWPVVKMQEQDKGKSVRKEKPQYPSSVDRNNVASNHKPVSTPALPYSYGLNKIHPAAIFFTFYSITVL